MAVRMDEGERGQCRAPATPRLSLGCLSQAPHCWCVSQRAQALARQLCSNRQHRAGPRRAWRDAVRDRGCQQVRERSVERCRARQSMAAAAGLLLQARLRQD